MSGMVGQCLPYSEVPGATRLVEDFLYSFEKVARFYQYDPWDATSVLRRLEKMDYPPKRRARLVEALRSQNPGCGGAERLADPGTVAVVTGQQVGLLTGPAYTFYKALTAVWVAEELSARGIPAVAVFWMATEDHDYAEVAECRVFDRHGAPVRIHAGTEEGAVGRPTGALVLPEWPVGLLEMALIGLPCARQALDLARSSYRPGRSWSAAFADLLGRLIGPGRLLFFDPLARDARELLAPALALAADRARDLVAALRERSGELERCGYHGQVRVEPEPRLFFVLEQGRRLPAKLEGGVLKFEGGSLEGARLEERARDLSAGALLRPVVQDWAFPTAVTVVGPSEIAYLAQAGALYEALGVEVPMRRPRVSCTLLDRRAVKLLDRYRLGLNDLFQSEAALREAIGAQVRPSGLAEALERSRSEVAVALDRIAEEVQGWQGPVTKAFEKSRSKIRYQMGKIERAVARESLRRHEQAERDARWLLDQLYPDGRLQERVYSILAFVARHGTELASVLRESVAWDCRGHQTVVV